jgi:hypothetical protein
LLPLSTGIYARIDRHESGKMLKAAAQASGPVVERRPV